MRFGDKIQLVFCAHEFGLLARSREIQPQPPLGLLILGSYLRKEFPNLEIEVLDGKCFSEEDLLERLDAPFIGFSTWFTNHDVSCAVAEKVKLRRPEVKVAMGGPHATWMADRIIHRRAAIDYVFRGEAEFSLKALIEGKPLDAIPGLVFRKGGIISQPDKGASLTPIELNTLPDIDLSILHPTYSWKSRPEGPAMSAFPFSGVRGCQRSNNRCEYCSIPTLGHRVMSPEKYWAQIAKLNQTFGIDYFFETGDTFPPKFFSEMGTHPERTNVSFRIYSYPGSNRPCDVPFMRSIGVKVIFMGIESVLHWQKQFKRRYRPGYSIKSLLEEIQLYGEAGIRVWPGFLLGLPGETEISLKDNIRLIERIAALPNVNELTVSIVLPLPGTDLFHACLRDSEVCHRYRDFTGDTLSDADSINFALLTELFVNRFTACSYDRLVEVCGSLSRNLGERMANWRPEPYLRGAFYNQASSPTARVDLAM